MTEGTFQSRKGRKLKNGDNVVRNAHGSTERVNQCHGSGGLGRGPWGGQGRGRKGPACWAAALGHPGTGRSRKNPLQRPRHSHGLPSRPHSHRLPRKTTPAPCTSLLFLMEKMDRRKRFRPPSCWTRTQISIPFTYLWTCFPKCFSSPLHL